MNRNIKIIAATLLSFSLISCNSFKEIDSKPTTSTDTNSEVTSNTVQFNVNSDGHVEAIMQELCSDEYRGRIVGTEENIKTQEYIKDFFKTLSLDYYDGEDYLLSNDECVIPVEENTYNVASMIKGTNSNKAVFITAHLDHVFGRDNSKLVGAIDNASGISVLLESAHKLKEISNSIPLDMDVVFVAFNAEEQGLYGSQNFYAKYGDRYSEFYNINIDCVGTKNESELAMGNTDDASDTLYAEMKKLFDEEEIPYNKSLYASNKFGIPIGTSDHAVVSALKKPALVLGDSKIDKIVHTPNDNLDNIDYSDLEKLSDAISKFIINNNGITFN